MPVCYAYTTDATIADMYSERSSTIPLQNQRMKCKVSPVKQNATDVYMRERYKTDPMSGTQHRAFRNRSDKHRSANVLAIAGITTIHRDDHRVRSSLSIHHHLQL